MSGIYMLSGLDSKWLHFLSSIHSDDTFDKTVWDRNARGGTISVIRPLMCEGYNQHMNGVDVCNKFTYSWTEATHIVD